MKTPKFSGWVERRPGRRRAAVAQCAPRLPPSRPHCAPYTTQQINCGRTVPQQRADIRLFHAQNCSAKEAGGEQAEGGGFVGHFFTPWPDPLRTFTSLSTLPSPPSVPLLCPSSRPSPLPAVWARSIFSFCPAVDSVGGGSCRDHHDNKNRKRARSALPHFNRGSRTGPGREGRALQHKRGCSGTRSGRAGGPARRTRTEQSGIRVDARP